MTRRRGFHGSPRPRATEWLASADVTDFDTLAAGAAVLDQTFSFGEDVTIMRTRGSIWVGTDQTAAAEFPFGALGLLIASDAAITAGVASLPTPITEESSELWFLHQHFAASFLFGDATGFASPSSVRYDFDSKAMRKASQGEGIGVLVENSSAADGLQYILKFRILVKLHA